ncbi:MAG TPA: hypothetical protein VEW11_00655 [Gaiellaceae bacterium]|nr:hypothetical protein [Gaiellaceae bacterium]
MTRADHHSEYLARAVAALTPEGRRRVDELLDELAVAGRGREWVVRFAIAREAEVDAGQTGAPADEPGTRLSAQETDVLTAGFMTIRDQEPLDDVADWANAVLALLADERPYSAASSSSAGSKTRTSPGISQPNAATPRRLQPLSVTTASRSQADHDRRGFRPCVFRVRRRRSRKRGWASGVPRGLFGVYPAIRTRALGPSEPGGPGEDTGLSVVGAGQVTGGAQPLRLRGSLALKGAPARQLA